MTTPYAAALLTLFISGAAVAATPQQTQCELDGNQGQMNACAQQRLSRADTQLNQLYKQQLQKLRGKSQERFRQSQRSWISYRDQVCAFESGPRADGGSMWPMQDALCKARMTTERNAMLEEYLQCSEGSCPPAQ